jgi:hypothetical protein
MVAITLTLTAIISILFGILILLMPKLLNYFVAIWLILTGILQILNIYLVI